MAQTNHAAEEPTQAEMDRAYRDFIDGTTDRADAGTFEATFEAGMLAGIAWLRERTPAASPAIEAAPSDTIGGIGTEVTQ